MKIVLLVVGKTEGGYLKDGIDIYLNRLKHYVGFELIEINPPSKLKKLNPNDLKTEEGKLILSQLKNDDSIVLLDEGGKEYSSRGFSVFLQKKMNASTKRLVFIVGGAFGFSDEVKIKATSKLAISQMTFSHQMIRLFFVEQLYRAYSILKGESYHND